MVIDNESLIVRPDIAKAHCRQPGVSDADRIDSSAASDGRKTPEDNTGAADNGPKPETKPTRFIGTAMISSERPARDIHRIVEAVVEQLTTLPGSEVTLKLEIDAEVPSGLDRAKVRTLIENANTLGFIEKTIK